MGTLAVVNLNIVWTAGFVDPALTRDEQPPDAWFDAARALDALPGGYRVLQLPGTEFGAFRWGYTVDPPLPAPGPPKNLSKDVLTRAAEAVPGKKLCWVVPTHHHGDHIGGAAALVRSSPDAKLVVAPGTRSLGERLAGPGRVVEVAGEGPLTLGEGDERMDIHRVTGALHADEMLFVYFPARRISFEGDLSDYVLASKRLLQVIDAHDFVLDRMYAVPAAVSTAVQSPSGRQRHDVARIVDPNSA